MTVDDPKWEPLIAAALAAQKNAYAPYSKFTVGASLRATTGKVYAGCNVENASYGGTICAERTAIGTGVTDGATAFDALVVVTSSDRTIAPCGICRQCLIEFSTNMPVLLLDGDGNRELVSMRDIFPHQFGKDDL